MICLYRGSRGRGKTLTMVKDAYQYHLNGYKVVSNMNLSFGKRITEEQLLSLDKDSPLHDVVLVLDELQLFFDSRNFSNKTHQTFSNFLQQIRKRNILILATTQYENTVEKRFRQHIDIIVLPKYYKRGQYCTAMYVDITKIEDPPFIIPRPSKVVIYYCPPVYKLYDTYEMLR